MSRELLVVVGAILAGVGVASSQTLVYQSTFPTLQKSWEDTFQWAPPSDGRLVLTIGNSDAAYDGTIALLDGTAWNTGQNLIYCPVIKAGVQQSTFEMDVRQSWGLRPWLWLFDNNNTNNSGYDTLTLQFFTGSVSDYPKSYLGTLTSSPLQQNYAEWTVDLDSPGMLLFNVRQKGSGGGTHWVYVDGQGVTDLRVGWGNPGATAPDWSTIEVAAGHHAVRLAHVDDYWPDNAGTRQTDVYLSPIPEPCTLSLLALGGLAVLRRRRNPASMAG